MFRSLYSPVPLTLLFLCLASGAAFAQTAPPIEYNRLVPGFVGEKKTETGYPSGTGFAAPNPWGTYTAYLMITNPKGQRTWRIENNLQQGNFTQGSTMYLLEGSRQALLVDTAQDTPEEIGKNDLTTVVRHLLGHNNDGSVRSNPVDFVVSNTHFHGDHTGKNKQMADRKVYYPDLDWPRNAPANYVPIKQGGGSSRNGSGQAVGEIALGDRTIQAINLYGHTPGSMGYLDRENNFLITGDALGSGVVWMHFGPVSIYADSLRQLKTTLEPLNNPAVLPAHFYQIAVADRPQVGIKGQPLGKQYVNDQLAAAEGVLNGTVIGIPYRIVGRNVALAISGSAGMTYSLGRLYPNNTGKEAYRALRIPGPAGSSPSPIDNIKSEFYLIRDGANNSFYLLKGSEKALLIGTGGGMPGLAEFVSKLLGNTPLEVIVTSEDAGQIGGLGQFGNRKIYLPKGATIAVSGFKNVSAVGQGDTIALGKDSAGRPLTLQVEPLSGHSASGLTLLSLSDRILFSGDALGTQAGDGGLILRDKLADFAPALATWRTRTDGTYDVVYTAHNFQWLTLPVFVDNVQAAVKRGMTEGKPAFTRSTVPLSWVVTAGTNADTVASVVVPDSGLP